MKIIRFFVLALLMPWMTGCAINTEKADIVTPEAFSGANIFYVQHFTPDRRNFHNDIAAQINKMGYTASAGEEQGVPADATILVTYKDKWMWDITNYMIELNIIFSDRNGMPLAVGESLHTSLTRLSPDEMIAEVLTNMFAKIKAK